MSDKKPPPLVPTAPQNRCPVCGEVSYSRAGIHPQCSARKSDQKRQERLKREKLVADTKKPASASTPWQKSCPKCKTVQHVRKKVCDCGHTFAILARPPTDESESS